MTSRWTIERILRDDDDASGQTVRTWHIEVADGSVVFRKREGEPFLMMRLDDVTAFVTDVFAITRAANPVTERDANTSRAQGGQGR